MKALMLLKPILAASAASAILGGLFFWNKQPPTFSIYYGSQATQEELRGYDVVVLHPDWSPDLALLRPEQKALAYLNVGEADEGKLTPEEEAQIGAKRNETWNSLVVDVRRKEWQDRVINVEAKKAIDAGFDGFMLDTVDSAIHLESVDPAAYAGMRKASIDLIARLRATYPNSTIMLNRGIDIWLDVAPHIDAVLAESTLTGYNFDTKTAFYLDQQTRDYYQEKIGELRQHYPNIERYSVDYWDMNDEAAVRTIYKTQRSGGLIPYVSTPQLNTIYKEPSA